jgi:hypothetical protein
MTEPRHGEMCYAEGATSEVRGFFTTWRVARSLDVLLAQVNDLAPHRYTVSDGSIGDAAHCPGTSDHCAKDITGLGSDVVTARDFTHDPAHGADMGAISEAIRLSRDRRVAYVIFNRRIFSSTIRPYEWRPYEGSNPHTGHMHVSVVHNALADNTNEWEIGDMTTPADFLNAELANGITVRNALYTTYLRLPTNLVARLDAILAAAEDDGDTTVVLDPSALEALTAIREDIAAVPTAEQTAEAVVTTAGQRLVNPAG